MRPALALFAALCLAAPTGAAAPSTFGPVIGNAILCRSHLDNAYFHAYLTSAFGPSYKREGGAFWFKADGTLWGAPVSDILLSDDSSEWVFIGAVTDSTPASLGAAIRAEAGVRYDARDTSPSPVLQSNPGSTIVNFKAKSKIFCAKYKPLPILR